MKKIILLLIIFILIVNIKAKITWCENYKDAENIAKQQSKPIFLLFTRTTCPTCNELSNKIKDGLLKSFYEKFIFVKINTSDKESKKQVTNYLKFLVKYVPTSFVIDFYNKERKIKEVDFKEIVGDISKYYMARAVKVGIDTKEGVNLLKLIKDNTTTYGKKAKKILEINN